MAQTYAQRIERGMAKALAEFPGISDAEAKKIARGHGRTGEHGVTLTALPGGEVVVTFRDPAKLDQALRLAEKYGQRAGVTLVGKDGKAINMYENKGHMAGRTLDSLKSLSESAGGFYEGVATAGGDHYDLGEAFPDGDDDVSEYQLIVY